MAVREVIQLGDPRLRERSQPVDDPGSREVAAICRDLRDTLAHVREQTSYGRAIAAPQIGVMQRIVFVNVEQPLAMINPTITDQSSEEIVVWDACLSFLSIFYQVPRKKWIRVRYQEPEGMFGELYCDGDMSELLQHEIDHLDGVLAIDRVTDTTTICTREEFEKRYRPASPYAVQ